MSSGGFYAVLDQVYLQLTDVRNMLLGTGPYQKFADGSYNSPLSPVSPTGLLIQMINPLDGKAVAPQNVVIIDSPRRITQLSGGPYVMIYDATGQTRFGEEGDHQMQEWTMGVAIRNTIASDAPAEYIQATFCLRTMAAQVRLMLNMWISQYSQVPLINTLVSPVEPVFGNADEYAVEFQIRCEFSMQTFETFPNMNMAIVGASVQPDGSVQYA